MSIDHNQRGAECWGLLWTLRVLSVLSFDLTLLMLQGKMHSIDYRNVVVGWKLCGFTLSCNGCAPVRTSQAVKSVLLRTSLEKVNNKEGVILCSICGIHVHSLHCPSVYTQTPYGVVSSSIARYTQSILPLTDNQL